MQSDFASPDDPRPTGVESPPTIRVASAPQGHVYIRHLADPDGDDGVVRLADPRPQNSPVGASWWPLVMLDVEWITAHAAEFDVFHMHFGFDSIDAVELGRIVDTLHELGKPLVYTVHDLRNPHQPDPTAHQAALDVLVPRAEELVTLTTGAAEEVAHRWGRAATVIPHPHVVGWEDLARARPVRQRPRVGLHLKSMRPNMNPLPVLEVLVDELGRRDLDLVIDVHTDVVTEGMGHYDADVAARLRDWSRHRRVEVHVHDYYSDDELVDYFLGLDLSVLAYRFGTHSGWLEACYDLGTRVLAPDVGYYHDQHDGVYAYHVEEDGSVDPAGIRAALDALPGAPQWRATVEGRRQQRTEIAAAHRRVYEEALRSSRTGGRSGPGAGRNRGRVKSTYEQ